MYTLGVIAMIHYLVNKERHIGDIVRVKSLKEIAKLSERGEDDLGNYSLKVEFTGGITGSAYNSFIIDKMSKYCGRDFVISDIVGCGSYKLEGTSDWTFLEPWVKDVDPNEPQLEGGTQYFESFDDAEQSVKAEKTEKVLKLFKKVLELDTQGCLDSDSSCDDCLVSGDCIVARLKEAQEEIKSVLIKGEVEWINLKALKEIINL